jgi:hypothetical protein
MRSQVLAGLTGIIEKRLDLIDRHNVDFYTLACFPTAHNHGLCGLFFGLHDPRIAQHAPL